MSKEFSFHTIEDFDKHIDESIPSYSLMTNGINSIVRYFLDDSATVYDVGCSTGRMLENLPHKGLKIGIDNSTNLLPESHDNVEYVNHDLVKGFKFSNACLVMSLFTLQFIRKDKRQQLLNGIYSGLNKGGGFIFAEKVYSSDPFFQEMFNFCLYDYKRDSFTEKEILDKEVDLRKIMKPNQTQENIEMLEEAGFKRIELYWKFYNFECWICKK